MAQITIGWYLIDESFEADGTIDVAIKDKRTNDFVLFRIEGLESYDKLIEYLDQNRQVGVLSKLKVANGN